MQEPKNEEEYPSLELAYEYVFYSYEWMLRRLEAAEDRIQRLLIFVTTLTVGFPIVVASLNKDAKLISGWWGVFAGLAVAEFAVFVIICMLARSVGGMIFPNPGNLTSTKWLSQSKQEFRSYMIRYAGKHHTKNNNGVKLKWWLTNVAIGIFAAEGLCWIVWALSVFSA